MQPLRQPAISGVIIEHTEQQTLPSKMQIPSLTKARTALQQGKIQEALETYRALLHLGRFEGKVIQDLNRAVDCYPMEASLWQALGEAYNQAGQLPQALEAYSKAIENLNRIKSA